MISFEPIKENNVFLGKQLKIISRKKLSDYPFLYYGTRLSKLRDLISFLQCKHKTTLYYIHLIDMGEIQNQVKHYQSIYTQRKL